MFTPMAQGTIRPWSERGFFLLFYKLFEADALPYRILVFATQIANLLLLYWIIFRLTHSRLAAFAAPLLWTANAALATTMCWTSDYNQIQCAFFLLLAFALYLRGHYWLQLVVFVLGFGALELNVVYPAILLAYVVTCQRSRKALLGVLPLFAISVLYYGAHRAFAPPQTSGPYVLYFDAALPKTLLTYWKWSFAPAALENSLRHSALIVVLFTVIVLGYSGYSAWKGRWLPLFFLLWFPITLAPLLPLKGHVTDYYLSIPTLGLSVVLALLLGERRLRLWGALAGVGYLSLQIPAARAGSRWYFERSREVRNLVLGVRAAREAHPGKTILVTDVTPDLYARSFAHSPFHALDIPEVYLAPDESNSPQTNLNENRADFVLPAEPVLQGLAQEEIEVYSASGQRLRNITTLYEKGLRAKGKPETPRIVDVGNARMTYLLGSSWYPLEGNFRWMPKRASLKIGGPQTGSEKLVLTGYCPPEQLRQGPLALSVFIDGEPLSPIEISRPETPFSRSLNLPPDTVGKKTVEVTLEVSRTIAVPAGGRPLGLAFGKFLIQ